MAPMRSIRGLKLVRWVRGPVKLHEKTFRIAIQPTFANLVGADLDEGVMAALFLNCHMKSPDIPRERPASRGVRGALEGHGRKKSVRNFEYGRRIQLRTEEMLHCPGPVGAFTDWIQSILSSGCFLSDVSRRNCSAMAQSPPVTKKRLP